MKLLRAWADLMQVFSDTFARYAAGALRRSNELAEEIQGHPKETE